MNATVQQLRAEVAGLDKQVAEMESATLRLRRVLEERRLALYESSGDGTSLHAEWIRAWLKNDHAETRRILDAMYPQPEPRVGLVIRDEPRALHSTACLHAVTGEP